jgi:hypothetical protein
MTQAREGNVIDEHHGLIGGCHVEELAAGGLRLLLLKVHHRSPVRVLERDKWMSHAIGADDHRLATRGHDERHVARRMPRCGDGDDAGCNLGTGLQPRGLIGKWRQVLLGTDRKPLEGVSKAR